MNGSFYNQLITDIQGYMRAEGRLMKVQGVEQSSRLLGLMIMLFAVAAIMVVGLIFLAIALAAWLEQWLPMWASYLVIAGAMLLVALAVVLGRRLWFDRPIEKHLSEVVMGNPMPLKVQKQLAENQVGAQRELLERDLAEVQRNWEQVEQLWQMIRGLCAK